MGRWSALALSRSPSALCRATGSCPSPRGSRRAERTRHMSSTLGAVDAHAICVGASAAGPPLQLPYGPVSIMLQRFQTRPENEIAQPAGDVEGVPPNAMSCIRRPECVGSSPPTARSRARGDVGERPRPDELLRLRRHRIVGSRAAAGGRSGTRRPKEGRGGRERIPNS
jgi:hypothetical protein